MNQQKNTETVNLYVESVKDLLRKVFKEQEQALIKILSSCTNTLNQRLDKIRLQVTENNNKLKEICKKTNDLKLSLDTPLNIYHNKLNKLEKTIEFEKEKKEKTWRRYGKTTTNFIRS